MLPTQSNLTKVDKPVGLTFRLKQKISSPVDIASLVYFRMVFGAIMLWEVCRFFQHGWIDRYYIQPQFYFKYFAFEWVHPWPGIGMYLHFVALGLLAVCIMLGLYYRVSSMLFFLGFTYVFLLDQTNYLNHFYLISLISFLLIFLPANRAFSLDVRRKPDIRIDLMPAWIVYLLRFQIAVPYVYGGIAKLNSDWLHGEPMRLWLSESQDFPLIGSLFTQEWVVYAFSWGGLIFDLLVVPLLFFRKTRWLGIVWLIAFHLLNSQLFSIGIFPWFMLFATPVFFSPQWSRKILSKLSVNKNVSNRGEPASKYVFPYPRVLAWSLGFFIFVQITFPFRHHLYPGNNSWTEEGHRFAWHMKLRDKYAEAFFTVTDIELGRSWSVDPAKYLTERQQQKMPKHPDMILQFSHMLASRWKNHGHSDVTVTAVVEASLNGRNLQTLIDPTVDLSRQPRTLLRSPWIVSLKEPLQRPANELHVSK